MIEIYKAKRNKFEKNGRSQKLHTNTTESNNIRRKWKKQTNTVEKKKEKVTDISRP